MPTASSQNIRQSYSINILENAGSIMGLPGQRQRHNLHLDLQNAKAAGKSFLGGNIGTNPLDFLSEITADSWVILELSNFQLIDFKYSPKIGVCLMMAPEHQDWHKTVKEYYETKKNLFIREAKTIEQFMTTQTHTADKR